MDPVPRLLAPRERGAALIIVLMLVVLLTALAVAYLSRTTGDRKVSQSSFHQSKVDQVSASAMDLIIGGLRQEITGPAPTPAPPYVPANNANMLPITFGNPDTTGIPNLIRRSVQGDGSTGPTISSPGVPSLASAVNSTTPSANGRFITLARWNKHYLVPKLNTGDNKTDPVASFVAPDWVILTQGDSNNPTTTPGGPVGFSTWDSTLADPTNAHYAVGRCAYAIYDEGSLLDANVVGYPNGYSPNQLDLVGRKGPVAFADLTALPSPSPAPPSPYFTNSSSPYQVDTLVGWRSYGTAGPINNFPNANFAANFRSGSGPASAYWTSLINDTPGFTTTANWNSGAVTNGRTDQ